MASTDKAGYVKQAAAGVLGLLMAPSAALAERKFLSLYTKKKFIYFVTLLFVLLGCASVYAQRPAHIPENVSSLLKQKNIVSGVKLIHPGRCSIIFREGYGRKINELNYLVDLIKYGAWIDRDWFDEKLECGIVPHLDALDYLIYLSTVTQLEQAAKLTILDYSKLQLDGELGEFYVENFMTKVLLKYNNLQRILDTKSKIKQVADDLCSASKNPNGDLDIKELIKKLENKNPKELASTIKKSCLK